MPTTNISLSSSWLKVADASNSKVLITLNAPYRVEYATENAGNAPTVIGHLLGPDTALTREVIGEGNIWARIRDGGLKPEATALLIVTK